MDKRKKPVKTSKKTIPGRNGGTLHPGDNGNGGRPKGSKNRSTIFKKWMEIATKGKNPISGQDEEMTIEDQMVLKIIGKVMKDGDVPAFREAMDSLYGKHKESIDHTTGGEKLTTIDPKQLSTETLKEILKAKRNAESE